MPEPALLVQRMIACFNGNEASLALEIFARDCVVHGSFFGLERSSKPGCGVRPLIEAYRSVIPDARLCIETVEQAGLLIAFRWRGTGTWKGHPQLVPTSPCAIHFSGTGRIRMDKDKVKEMWFILDVYDVLSQLGLICADPGQSRGRSAVINRTAAEALRQAILGRALAVPGFDAELTVHANIVVYRNLEQSFETTASRFDGPGKLEASLDCMRSKFSTVNDLQLDDGVSQGSTTTFRGAIQVILGGRKQRYEFLSSFTAPIDRVSELWLQVTPPPSLKECIL